MKRKKSLVLALALAVTSLMACGCGALDGSSKAVVEDGISAYKKLADGKNLNLLIVGDSIAAGTGATGRENSWAELVSMYLSDTYGSEIRMTNVSMGGCDSLCGYVRVQNLDDGIDNDLAIVCYGENDAEEDFGLYYESILRALRNKYPSIEIICVQESSQMDYTYKMQCISEIAEHYKLPVADTIEPFMVDYDNLTVDGCHPNNDGHKIYADVVERIIDDKIQSGDVGDYNIEPYDENVTFFDHYTWIPESEFRGFGKKLTATLPVGIYGSGNATSLSDGDGTYLIVDIIDEEGSNNFKVYFDDTELASRDFIWDYAFEQRHIPILARDVVLDKGKISIKFDSKKQIRGFEGIGFIG